MLEPSIFMIIEQILTTKYFNTNYQFKMFSFSRTSLWTTASHDHFSSFFSLLEQ